MARVAPIRITANDKRMYAQLARNTKAKIRRTNQNYGLDLSSEIDVPSLDEFNTRDEFNEWKQRVKSFTNRANTSYQYKKNEFGVVASKAEINQIQRDTKQAQRIADQAIEKAKKLPFISGGKQQGTVEQRMLQMNKPNAAGIHRPPDFDFNKVKSRQQIKNKKGSMEKRSDIRHITKRMETMKENFIYILLQSYNSDADELADKIKTIPADDFVEMYQIFDEFDFDKYDSENDGGFKDEGKLSMMLDYVNQYFEGKIDMDLKPF